MTFNLLNVNVAFEMGLSHYILWRMSSFIFKVAVTTHSHCSSRGSANRDVLQTSITPLAFLTQGYKTKFKFLASENAKGSLKHEEEKTKVFYSCSHNPKSSQTFQKIHLRANTKPGKIQSKKELEKVISKKLLAKSRD